MVEKKLSSGQVVFVFTATDGKSNIKIAIDKSDPSNFAELGHDFVGSTIVVHRGMVVKWSYPSSRSELVIVAKHQADIDVYAIGTLPPATPPSFFEKAIKAHESVPPVARAEAPPIPPANLVNLGNMKAANEEKERETKRKECWTGAEGQKRLMALLLAVKKYEGHKSRGKDNMETKYKQVKLALESSPDFAGMSGAKPDSYKTKFDRVMKEFKDKRRGNTSAGKSIETFDMTECEKYLESLLREIESDEESNANKKAKTAEQQKNMLVHESVILPGGAMNNKKSSSSASGSKSASSKPPINGILNVNGKESEFQLTKRPWEESDDDNDDDATSALSAGSGFVSAKKAKRGVGSGNSTTITPIDTPEDKMMRLLEAEAADAREQRMLDKLKLANEKAALDVQAHLARNAEEDRKQRAIESKVQHEMMMQLMQSVVNNNNNNKNNSSSSNNN